MTMWLENNSGDLLFFTFEGITSYYTQSITWRNWINSSYNSRGWQLKAASWDASKTTIWNAAGTAELGDEDCLGDFSSRKIW